MGIFESVTALTPRSGTANGLYRYYVRCNWLDNKPVKMYSHLELSLTAVIKYTQRAVKITLFLQIDFEDNITQAYTNMLEVRTFTESDRERQARQRTIALPPKHPWSTSVSLLSPKGANRTCLSTDNALHTCYSNQIPNARGRPNKRGGLVSTACTEDSSIRHLFVKIWTNTVEQKPR